MKKTLLYSFIIIAGLLACHQKKTEIRRPEIPENATNFIIANDLGRNGHYEQKTIAAQMGDLAENIDIELIAAAGDVHHFEGVASVNDPLWMTNYELIYDHPELMIDWFAVAGNHEYRGNTQAILDYSKVSRRWNAPEKYYTQVIKTGDNTACRLVFIDSSPLISKYRKDSLKYPDACKQDAEKQLAWIDSVLTNAPEKWKIVIGHHPVYADTPKEESERADMQTCLAPILEKSGTDIYFCGHIHNFQHIKPKNSSVEYVVNSSGSLARKVKTTEDTRFCSPEAGFTLCSLTDNELSFFFINGKGEEIYNYKITK